MWVCVFIKLHITAQFGSVILVIPCHSHWSSQGVINDTCYENLWWGVCVCVCVCVCLQNECSPFFRFLSVRYRKANSNIPQRLGRARASQIWVQHPPHPYTPVHNAANTDEAQTCWGRLQSYDVSDGTASRAAGVRLKKMRGSGLRCDITGRTDGRTFTFFFLVHWSLKKPKVS